MAPTTGNSGLVSWPSWSDTASARGRKNSAGQIVSLPDAWGRISGSEQMRSLKVGESLCFQGDRQRLICILREGWAFRYQCLADGRRQIVDFLLPGDAVGIDQSPQRPYGVEALSPCTWTTISHDGFFKRLPKQPRLSLTLIAMLSAAQLRGFDSITSIGRRTAHERVAHLLFTLGRRVRESAAGRDGEDICLPLGQSHIADALGLATETVCRSMAELKRSGILVYSEGQWRILSLNGLADLAEAAQREGGDKRAVSQQPSAAA